MAHCREFGYRINMLGVVSLLPSVAILACVAGTRPAEPEINQTHTYPAPSLAGTREIAKLQSQRWGAPADSACEPPNDGHVPWDRAKITLQQIVDKSYPELSGRHLELRELGPVGGKIAFLITSPFSGNIYARRDVIERMANDALRGILAHELVHAVQYSKLNFTQKCSHLLVYVFSSDNRAETERGADLEAIARGYGRDLLAAKEFGRRCYPQDANYGKFYLTEDEVRKELGSRLN